jgi:hypothetical protein
MGTLEAPSGHHAQQPGLDLRIQGACDPSNIGARPQRVVRVAVVDETMF